MKPFNAKEATIGCEVKTRNEKKGRIICLDAESAFPVIALIDKGGYEDVETYTVDGTYDDGSNPSNLDIFFPTKKHEGWVTIFKYGQKKRTGYEVFSSKEECEEEYGDNVNFIAAAHIEWEE